MKNIGIQWIKTADSKTFTSGFGIKLRRSLSLPFRWVMRVTTGKKIVVESYPKLEKNTPYIFASTHLFYEDILTGVGCIDRHAYVLVGNKDQIEHNPRMYGAWANGLIFVDRSDPDSRHSAVDKMEWIIRSGSSMVIFPEGTWNNSENALMRPLFAGPYLLAERTGAKIVPICSFWENGGDTIYFNASEPIDVSNRTKAQVREELRDALATMMYLSMEKHSQPLNRQELTGDLHEQHLAARCAEYLKMPWKNPDWTEETYYRDKNHPTPDMIWPTFEKVKLTPQNAKIMVPIFEEIERIKKYNFVSYMQGHWEKENNK